MYILMKHLTCDTRGEEAGEVTAEHGGQSEIGDGGALTGREGRHHRAHDPHAAEVREAAQGVRPDQLTPLLVCEQTCSLNINSISYTPFTLSKIIRTAKFILV